MDMWLVVAGVGVLLTAAGAVVFIVRYLRSTERVGRDGEPLPMTLLQRRAWWGLGISTLTALLMLGVYVAYGPTVVFADRRLRLLVTSIFLAGLAAYLLMRFLIGRGQSDDGADLDERDRQIMNRAPAVQAAAVLCTLAAWAVLLTELYWSRGSIPICYPYLILWSCLLVHVIAHSVGVLVGYWRVPRHA